MYLLLKLYLSLFKGQLIQEVNPTCSNGTAVYRCTGGAMGNLITWSISGAPNEFIFQYLVTPQGSAQMEVISSAPVVFTVTEATSSAISVTLTILDPVPLNDVRMECSGDMLQILAPSSSKFYIKFYYSQPIMYNYSVLEINQV